MNFQKRTAFSFDNKYFACISTGEKLLIWETSSNKVVECKFDPSVYGTCSSIHWISTQQKNNSPRNAKVSKCIDTENLLAVGTVKGDILIYNVTEKTLYTHLVARHSDAVNDMHFYEKSLFSCSNDKCIGIWDITSGKQIMKWQADDSPISSICVIDDNNMLSSSTSILWWNISEKTVVKKFVGHSTEIFKLLPVNAVSLNSCYFLSAAVNDTKINAWSLNSFICETPVTSFVLPDEPENLDISNSSSKDKPLILSVVTKDGILHLFEHILNGNVTQPVHPKVSMDLKTKTTDSSFMHISHSYDSESCLVACESNQSQVFKRIKIKELLRERETENAVSYNYSAVSLPVVNDTSKVEKNLSVNGLKTSSTSPVKSNYKGKLRSSAETPVTKPKMPNSNEENTIDKEFFKDPKSAVESLIEAIESRNEKILEAVFHHSDTDFISASVNHIPTSSLKTVLDELNRQLHEKYSPALRLWLKEIFRIHLRYLIQSQDAIEPLNQTKKLLDSMEIRKTIHKMNVLEGFLNLQLQNTVNEDESDSDNGDQMES